MTSSGGFHGLFTRYSFVDNYPHVTPGSRATLGSNASAAGRLTKEKLALPVLDALASERRETLFIYRSVHNFSMEMHVSPLFPHYLITAVW